MAGRARTVVRSRTGQRRAMSWREIQATSATLTAVGGTITHSLDAVELAKRPFTIIRTHLVVSIISDQVAADEAQFGAFGMAVVSEQAEAIGVTAVPTPVTDANSDLWFVHQWLMNEVSVVSAVGFNEDGAHQYLIDSKAMRKVEEGEDVVGVAEFSAAGGGIIVRVAGRLLLKEH